MKAPLLNMHDKQRYWRYSDVMDEAQLKKQLAQELALIWTVQRTHQLDGVMRLYSPRTRDIWQCEETGIEIWFGPSEIMPTVEKLLLLYKNGVTPNTPLFLDPIVYQRKDEAISARGSAVMWATALNMEHKQPLPPRSWKRLEDLKVFTDDIQYHTETHDVLIGKKCIGFLNTAMQADKKAYHPDGGEMPVQQAILDMVDLDSDAVWGRKYLLSGLKYPLTEGGYLYHPLVTDLVPEHARKSANAIKQHVIYADHLQDAATCFNAFERNHVLFTRYGVDVANLKQNVQAAEKAEARVANIMHEIRLLWHANMQAGLDGAMRLYTAPNQDIWRSKDAGVQLWFDGDTLEDLPQRIQFLYNGGVLPNSPLLLDPMMYTTQDDGQKVPLGTTTIWTTALFTGQTSFDQTAIERMKDISVYASPIMRAGEMLSGLKVLAFLERPYRCSAEEQAAFLSHLDAHRRLTPPEDALDIAYEGVDFDAWDAVPIPPCKQLCDLVHPNSTEYAPYFMANGLEYLCANGAYSNDDFGVSLPENPMERDAFMAAFSVCENDIAHAAACWEAYDQHHVLWQRFGVDIKNLEENLRYYELCGRDFSLLDMTGESRDDLDEEFQFFVPGWIPKSAITLIGATGGTGKSSLAHRLALLAASDFAPDDPNPLWLGSEIDKADCKGLAVYFSGEDSAAIVNARADLMDPEGKSKRLLLKCGADFGGDAAGKEAQLGGFLDYLHKLPDVSIVVIDPARKYLEGDEEDSEVVSQFFEAIESFSIAKKCPVIVVHHLIKEAKPKDTRDIIDMLRGSQVFIDRPRVVIGLMRDGAYTIAGLAKNNIPPKLGMVEGERVFVRDPKYLDLLWLPGEEGVRHFGVSEAELEQIKAEVEAKKRQESA